MPALESTGRQNDRVETSCSWIFCGEKNKHDMNIFALHFCKCDERLKVNQRQCVNVTWCILFTNIIDNRCFLCVRPTNMNHSSVYTRYTHAHISIEYKSNIWGSANKINFMQAHTFLSHIETPTGDWLVVEPANNRTKRRKNEHENNHTQIISRRKRIHSELGVKRDDDVRVCLPKRVGPFPTHPVFNRF